MSDESGTNHLHFVECPPQMVAHIHLHETV